MEPVRLQGANVAMRPVSITRPIMWLLEHLVNHNPFYVISAALILFGLHSIFQDRDALAQPNAVSFNSWLLLGLLAGYALLLAGTGILIVRLGQIWDDARTILLTLVLLFVAASVSFDKLVLTSSATLSQVLVVGLLFAVAISELVLRGLRIRLPVLFRAPYYLMLGLFFLYPILLMHLLDRVGDGDPKRAMDLVLWGIFLFPSVAAGIVLLLLPAVWRGPAYVADSGTPWRWPLFPWSLFAFLGVGIVLRSYYLTISFHPFPGVESAFGLYFLTPFVLSVCLIVFELGRSAGRARIQSVALVAPAALLWLTMPGTKHSPVYAQFLAMVMDRAGSPVLLTWWGLLALYVYAWLRGARQIEVGIVAILLMGSVLDRATVDFDSLRFPAVWPLVLATAVLIVGAVRRPTESARWFAAAATAIGASTVAFWGTPFLVYHGAAPIHLLLGTILLLGAGFDDHFARFLRHVGALGILILGLEAIAFPSLVGPVSEGVVVAYLMFLSGVAWTCWRVQRSAPYLLAACSVSVLWLGKVVALSLAGVGRLRNPAAAWSLLGGLISFLSALLISLFKGGVIWRRRGVPDTVSAPPPDRGCA